MIQYRVRGISNLVTACQCLLTLVLFWLWIALYQAFVPTSEGINLEYYAGYGFLIVVGLWLEAVFRDQPSTTFHPHRPSIIGQIPQALRQTAVAVGFLLLVLVLSKDRYLSRLFLFTFIPALYAMLLLSGHLLPRFLGTQSTLFSQARESVLLAAFPMPISGG